MLRKSGRNWLKTSGPMFAVWAFYMMLTYIDVLVLREFQPPEVVAHYYAAAKSADGGKP